MRRLSVVGAVCGLLALLLTVLGPAGAGTIDLWSDIGSSPFREEVNNIGSAGCANGFADGTFRPRDQVTRQQFAYWMNHCGGRVAHATGALDVQPSANPTSIARVTLEPGAVDTSVAESGFAVVYADAAVSAPAAEAADCPCHVEIWLADDTHQVSTPPVPGTLTTAVDESGFVVTNLSTTRWFVATPGEPTAYELRARYVDDENPVITFSGELTVLYVPFGADGGNDVVDAS